MRKLIVLLPLLLMACGIDLSEILVPLETPSVIESTVLDEEVQSEIEIVTIDVPKNTYFIIISRDNTLWGIAEEVYGNAERWEEIYNANRDTIEDPSLIKEGQKLFIPNFEE